MVIYPKFIDSLDDFDTLLQSGRSFSPSWEINLQFNRYLRDLIGEISINSRLNNNARQKDFLELKATIFPEVINILPKLKRLERIFETKKLAVESMLAESRTDRSISANPEVQKGVEGGQIQIDGPVDPEAVGELIWMYDEQIKNIRRYMERLLEALVRYFQKDITRQSSINVIRSAFSEDHPLRQGLEEKIKQISASQNNKIANEGLIKKFLKSGLEQKTNGSRGGRIKGERLYQEFKKVIDTHKIDVREYAESSQVNFMNALKSKGFAISEKTAGVYKRRYLSELNARK